jgi:hypothetical protein
MRKRLFLCAVFVILALAISLGVYFGERRARQIRFNRRAAPSGIPPRTYRPVLPSGAQRPAAPNPPRPFTSPNDNIQRTLQTIADVQRVNRMNAEAAAPGRQKPSSPPSTPKPPSNK